MADYQEFHYIGTLYDDQGSKVFSTKLCCTIPVSDEYPEFSQDLASSESDEFLKIIASNFGYDVDDYDCETKLVDVC